MGRTRGRGEEGQKKAPRLPGQEPGGTPGIPRGPRAAGGRASEPSIEQNEEGRRGGGSSETGVHPWGPAAGGLWGPEGG